MWVVYFGPELPYSETIRSSEFVTYKNDHKKLRNCCSQNQYSKRDSWEEIRKAQLGLESAHSFVPIKDQIYRLRSYLANFVFENIVLHNYKSTRLTANHFVQLQNSKCFWMRSWIFRSSQDNHYCLKVLFFQVSTSCSDTNEMEEIQKAFGRHLKENASSINAL